MDGDGSEYKDSVMKAFKESNTEGYGDIDETRLMNKFSGEGYQDDQESVKQNLSSLYGE